MAFQASLPKGTACFLPPRNFPFYFSPPYPYGYHWVLLLLFWGVCVCETFLLKIDLSWGVNSKMRLNF